MNLVSIADAEGFDVWPATQRACWVRAILANFKTGIAQDHVVEGLARDYFSSVLDQANAVASSTARANGRLHVDQLYRIMVQVFETEPAQRFFSRKPQPQQHLDKLALSFQPHLGFEHWLAPSVVEMGIHDPHPTTIKLLCRALLDPSKQRIGATLGRDGDVLWLTPLDGDIKQYITSAEQEIRINRHPQGVADRLRQILGLVRRSPGEHAVALITRDPLGRVGGTPGGGVFAPTIFEARNYERFRHWPSGEGDELHHVGRTYDLDRKERRRARGAGHGAPEIVCGPLPLRAVGKVIYLGVITGADDLEFEADIGEWRTRVEADREFAEEISGGEEVGSIVEWLARRLAL